jgi:hypothetical protein
MDDVSSVRSNASASSKVDSPLFVSPSLPVSPSVQPPPSTLSSARTPMRRLWSSGSPVSAPAESMQVVVLALVRACVGGEHARGVPPLLPSPLC